VIIYVKKPDHTSLITCLNHDTPLCFDHATPSCVLIMTHHCDHATPSCVLIMTHYPVSWSWHTIVSWSWHTIVCLDHDTPLCVLIMTHISWSWNTINCYSTVKQTLNRHVHSWLANQWFPKQSGCQGNALDGSDDSVTSDHLLGATFVAKYGVHQIPQHPITMT